MSFRKSYLTAAPAESKVLAVMVLVTAALAGAITAVVGSAAGYRAVYYVAVFGLIVIGGIVALTRAEPLRFVFLALIVCFPVANFLVPPGRIGLNVFDVIMIALTLGLIGRKLLASSPAGAPLFPTRSWLFAWLMFFSCVVFSQFPGVSLLIFIVCFAVYAFFLLALEELRREGGFERLVLLFSIVLLVMAAGILLEHYLHINLSARGGNLNRVTYSSSGLEIYRAAGFFQDPQKGGAFNAGLITFLLVLAVRGRFRGMKLRFLVWAAIVAGLVALITTISRAAIVACLGVSVLAVFAFNRWNAVAKLMIAGGAVLAAAGVALTPVDTWLDMLPATVAERFRHSGEEFAIRLKIWFDTWEMFAKHPLTGIGPGSFQPYLMQTRPTVFNYYGIGEAAGVAYIPDQPESGYLKILYEGGIAGSAAALLVVGDALRRALAVIAFNPADSHARSEGVAALAGLLTLALTFITLFTVGDERVLALFALLLAAIWHRSLQGAQSSPKA